MTYGKMFANVEQQKPVQMVINNKPLGASNSNVSGLVTVVQNLKMEDINSFGSGLVTKSADLSREVLSKVKMKDTGEFGTGINQIITLMSGVDLSKLSADTSPPSFFKKLGAKVIGMKLAVMDQYEDAAQRIDGVVTTLRVGITRQKGEAQWLKSQYKENLILIRDYAEFLEAIQLVTKTAEQEMENIEKFPDHYKDLTPEGLEDKRLMLDRLSRQCDKLNSSLHLAKLTAPQIRSMQVSGYENTESFNDLIDTVIPSWQKQMSFGIMAVQQAKDADLTKTIKDKANENIRAAATMVKNNLIATTQNSQRGTYDMATLQHVQTEMIAAITERKRIEQLGRDTRKANVATLEQMDQVLQQEMKKW